MKDIEHKFYVTYKVLGFPSEKKAGPYAQKDINYQVDDIGGYEGVYDVKVVDATENLK